MYFYSVGKYIFPSLLILLSCLHACNYVLPQHEKIIYSEQSGVIYTMQYIDSAGRGFQNAADTIVKNIAAQMDQTSNSADSGSGVINKQDEYICNSLAAMLESYGVKNYNITVGPATLTKGHSFNGSSWTPLN